MAAQETDLAEAEDYAESRFRLKALGLATPPEMEDLRVDIGWPGLYLRAMERRLDIEGFRLAGKSEGVEDLWDWWQANNLDEESTLGHMDALTYGRAYITVSAPLPDDEDKDTPVIRLESPRSMFAELDPRTRKVRRAIRFYKARALHNEPERATLMLPNETVLLVRSQGAASAWSVEGRVNHNLGVVPVVPLTHGAKLGNRYGSSLLTPEVRTVTDAAARLMMDLQAAAELLAVPLRVIFGAEREEIAPNGTKAELEDAYYGRLLAFGNEMGKAFSFPAAELRNFTEAFESLARQFASYTGLPPQYLMFSSDNPASAEAILAANERMVREAERISRQFGGAWEDAMRLALKVMKKPVPKEFRRLEVVWRDPATPTFAAAADGWTKLATAKTADGRPIVPVEMARIKLGFTDEERTQMEEWDEKSSSSQLAKLLAAPTIPGQDPADPNAKPVPAKPQSAAKAPPPKVAPK
ncbi:phage portal protein [Nocardia sp. IFM 10818]